MQSQNRALLVAFAGSLALLGSDAAPFERSLASRPPRLTRARAAEYRAAREPTDPIERLERALQASRRDPSSLQAVQDRAFALEELGLRRRAIEAWRTYLELDPQSDESEQVRQRLDELVGSSYLRRWEMARRRLPGLVERGDLQALRRVVHQFPQTAREHAEETLFAAWADARERGDPQAAERMLRLAERLGAAVLEETGDAMVRDAAAALREATSSTDEKRLDHLVRGHQLYRDAKASYDRYELAAAAEPFERSAEELARGGSPFAAWSEFHVAVCTYWRNDLEGSAERFQELQGAGPGRLVVRGHAEWMLGLIRNRQGRFGDSLRHYQEALALFEQAHQAQNVPQVEALLAYSYFMLGELREAWLHHRTALLLLERVRKQRWQVTVLQEAAETCNAVGFPLTAIELAGEAVRIADVEGIPGVRIEALVFRSRLHEKQSDLEAAEADLRNARAILGELGDPDSYDFMEAQLLTAEAGVLHRTDPGRAVATLDAAIEKRAGAGAQVFLPGLLLARGRAHRALGHRALAVADLLTSIEGFERGRGTIDSQRLQISLFDQAREAFDAMMELQFEESGDPWSALDFAERARARTLLEMVSGGGEPPPSVGREATELRRRLPKGLAVVEYAVLEKSTLAWVLTRRAATAFRLPIGRAELERRVDALLDAVETGASAPALRRPAARLHEALLQPLADALLPDDSLVFVPDKALHVLPFGLLYDARSARYLIEERVLAAAPSAALLLEASAQERALGARRPQRALVIGDPAFERRAFPHLARLPGSAREARAIAGLYPAAELLLDAAATESRFLDAAGRAAVLHFGGHAAANLDVPLLSHLLLAPDPTNGDDGVLTAQEIYGRRLTETRVVVLAACRTGRARISPAEGVLSLARPFLAAGVPAVVASLWAAEDHASAVLFEVFHRQLLGGAPATEALRAAQLALLHHPDPALRAPKAWAAFEVIR